MRIVRHDANPPWHPPAPTTAEAAAAAAATMRPTPAFAQPDALARRTDASLAEGNDGLGTLGRLPGELRNQVRDLLPPRAVGDLATLSSRNAFESHVQRTGDLEDRLGCDLAALTRRDQVLAFGSLLMKLPTERREPHLRGLALRALVTPVPAARQQIAATVKTSIDAEDATPKLKAAWAGVDPRMSMAVQGRAWALATTEERHAVVDANASQGRSRSATEVAVITALGVSGEWDEAPNTDIAQLATSLNIETEAGLRRLALISSLYAGPSEPSESPDTREVVIIDADRP